MSVTMFKSRLLQTLSSFNSHFLRKNMCISLPSSPALKSELALRREASYCEILAILFNKSVHPQINSLKSLLA